MESRTAECKYPRRKVYPRVRFNCGMNVASGLKKAVSGVLLGIVSYVTGYAIMAGLVYNQVAQSYESLGFPVDFSVIRNRVGTDALPSAIKITGWMWETAHTVPFNFRAGAAFGGEISQTLNFSTTTIWGDFMYLIPPAILLLAGVIHHRINGESGSFGGIGTGISLAIGYGIVFGAGLYLTRWILNAGILVVLLFPVWDHGFAAGFIYPLIFGTVGGYAGYLSEQ